MTALSELVPVLVEMRVRAETAADVAHQLATRLKGVGFVVDPLSHPVPVKAMDHHAQMLAMSGDKVMIAHGHVPALRLAGLRRHRDVIHIWRDVEIGPFVLQRRRAPHPAAEAVAAAAHSPHIVYDSTYGDPANGSLDSVVKQLGVDQIWATGHRGEGIVIGIVDGGICAIDRRPKDGETPRIPNVIDGFPHDWGTTAMPASWQNHGNMTATDALAIAPKAKIYDIRVSDGGREQRIRNALKAFDWAIKQHRRDGTPHILSCSWGIWQRSQDQDYATDPDHPFTRKVVEAMDEGILVLFCAGNCGARCSDERCGDDFGANRGIWGANGHRRVMTVGAVNLQEHLACYSSIGPAALDPDKPDFCSFTHFAGYFPHHDPDMKEPSDTGTSAATAITAGVVALLKQRDPRLTQDEALNLLRRTAKDIGPPGFDRLTGMGVIDAKAAWDGLAHLRAAHAH
jgi:subtilisin family serine protease